MGSLNMRSLVVAVREYFRTHHFKLIIPVAVAVVIVATLLWTAFVALKPLPPHTVTMATGPEGGAFYEVATRYREILAREGIKLVLLPTGGAVENLARLRDPRSNVDVGFLQGGITSEKESPDLESLGTVFYEPLWIFYRGSSLETGLKILRGRKISIGPEGSGTRSLALELLTRNGINQNITKFFSYSPREAGEKLLEGKIDAALIIAAWDSPTVRRLLSDRRVELTSFPRADAYVALYPFLSKLIVPAGVGDLAKNRPPKDVFLIAPKASLIVRKELHPAIQYLLLDAAEQIHSGPGIFQKSGQFPAAETFDVPLSDNARQFYKSGRPFLQRHLPFWLAVFIDRLVLVLIPVVGVIYPLVRFMPAFYAWEIRWRIFRLYGELRQLDKDLESRGGTQNIDDMIKRLDQLEDKAKRLRVPLFYANLLYTLRMHITLVNERLRKHEGSTKTG